MTLDSWVIFCVTEAILCFTPGPAVLLVVSLSLSAGARAGLRAALGILAANTFYFVLSGTGVGAILMASWELFTVIKWAGAAYLIWIGLKMILSRSGQPAPAGGAPPSVTRPRSSFMHGLVTQGANPKAIVFFTALLPQFIDPRAPVAGQVAILGISSIVIELGVLALYVAACHSARAMVRRPGVAATLDRAGGLLLIGAGAGLATMRRT